MRIKAFHYLWISRLLAQYGNVFFMIALLTQIIEMNGSPLQITMVPFEMICAKLAGTLIFKIVTGHIPFQKLSTIFQWLKTFLLVFLTIAVAFKTEIFFFILVALIAFIEGLPHVAKNTMNAHFLKREALLKTNGLSVTAQIIQVSSWAIGGVLVVVCKPDGLLLLTTILSFLAGIMMLEVPEREFHHAGNQPFSSYINSIKSGWLLVWEKKNLRFLYLLYVMKAFANVVWIATVLLIFAKWKMNAGEVLWGLLNSSYFCGLMLANFLLFKMHGLISSKMQRVLWLCTIMAACTTALFGITEWELIALFLSFLSGCFDRVQNIILNIMVQTSTKIGELHAVYACQKVLSAVAIGPAILLAGWVAERFGVSVLYYSAALLSLSTLLLIPTIKIEKNPLRKSAV